MHEGHLKFKQTYDEFFSNLTSVLVPNLSQTAITTQLYAENVAGQEPARAVLFFEIQLIRATPRESTDILEKYIVFIPRLRAAHSVNENCRTGRPKQFVQF